MGLFVLYGHFLTKPVKRAYSPSQSVTETDTKTLNKSCTVHYPHDRGVLALKLKPLIAEKAKKRMLSGKADPGQKSDRGKTFDQLAKIAGVSHDTIHKIEVIEKKASPEAKQAEYYGNQYGGLSQKSANVQKSVSQKSAEQKRLIRNLTS